MSICLCEAPIRECARVSACALCACVCVWREERGTKGKRGVLSTTNVKQFPAFFCISDTATNREQETRQNRGVEQFKSIGERIWFLVEKKKRKTSKMVAWNSSKSIGVTVQSLLVFFFCFKKKETSKMVAWNSSKSIGVQISAASR